jgi:hypothetical protein
MGQSFRSVAISLTLTIKHIFLILVSLLQVYAGDGLPAQVCQQCVQQVNICYNFKIQCEKSDANLREYLHSLQPQEFSIQVGEVVCIFISFTLVA